MFYLNQKTPRHWRGVFTKDPISSCGGYDLFIIIKKYRLPREVTFGATADTQPRIAEQSSYDGNP